jgi:hypothetical protein
MQCTKLNRCYNSRTRSQSPLAEGARVEPCFNPSIAEHMNAVSCAAALLLDQFPQGSMPLVPRILSQLRHSQVVEAYLLETHLNVFLPHPSRLCKLPCAKHRTHQNAVWPTCMASILATCSGHCIFLYFSTLTAPGDMCKSRNSSSRNITDRTFLRPPLVLVPALKPCHSSGLGTEQTSAYGLFTDSF